MTKITNIILGKDEYLSKKIDCLPCGIINKTETGIGATTVEFNAKRNSIIVEPLKVTASTKAFEHKDTLYVGSPTTLHPKKITQNDIKKYIEDNVDIGSLCTIDKGVTASTKIGEGSKLDNQVHIGHDTVLGKRCLVASQVGISGCVVIEST